MIQPRIVNLLPKKLAGLRLSMSLAENKTGLLWQSFMPRRNAIGHQAGAVLFSMRVYAQVSDIGQLQQQFDKWAAVEVTDFDAVPAGMETFDLAGGLYAVFDYKGSSSDPRIFRYIYGEWLPASDYVADERPHFELLGEKYRNNDPDSEEEIWVPIKPKK